MMDDTMLVFADWEGFARCCAEAVEADEWAEFSHALHTGHLAIVVDGLPRVIDGTVH